MEQTFLMVKPDGVKRGLIGEIVKRFETKGFSIVQGKIMTINEELARMHYKEHEGKPFFDELVSFITSGPVFAFVVEGNDVVSVCRLLIGKTDPKEALPGTIRGDFAFCKTENVIHGSDSTESAKREIGLFFS